eukprot:gnl/TRDRNA2_/TRDRNA2_156115_c0_seq2.p1 gnl/TRDRNA2_/TRDRNA2_156115_c0~~gnl/TRDRNA2_/TRDRNA2_156115_c0_seq2.p1  ORF type:complete len:518 (+),score=41.87 gnl/TRDRNA2_/TRDRNA2_156115_c0_seq2:124-1554(+)
MDPDLSKEDPSEAVPRQRVPKEDTGYVYKYMPQKGYGFINPDAGGDNVFFHVYHVIEGGDDLHRGDIVAYRTEFNSRKGQRHAIRVRRTHRARKRHASYEHEAEGSKSPLQDHERERSGGDPAGDGTFSPVRFRPQRAHRRNDHDRQDGLGDDCDDELRPNRRTLPYPDDDHVSGKRPIRAGDYAKGRRQHPNDYADRRTGSPHYRYDDPDRGRRADPGNQGDPDRGRRPYQGGDRDSRYLPSREYDRGRRPYQGGDPDGRYRPSHDYDRGRRPYQSDDPDSRFHPSHNYDTGRRPCGSGDPGGQQSDDADQGRRGDADHPDEGGNALGSRRQHIGTVQRWNDDRGFGFIKPDDGGEELFYHTRDLVDGEGSVRRGDRVVFLVRHDERKGMVAVKVQSAEDAAGAEGAGGSEAGERRAGQEADSPGPPEGHESDDIHSERSRSQSDEEQSENSKSPRQPSGQESDENRGEDSHVDE